MGKKILVINPNTSEQMTGEIERTVLSVRDAQIGVEISHSDFGPESLESSRDYTVAGYAMLQKYSGMADRYDGVLIACFGDPALYAMKEVFPCPVIGIAEASISIALLLGYKFSLLGASQKAAPMFDAMVQQYGLRDRLANIETIDLDVTQADQDKEETVKRLLRAGASAKAAGAEVLILGCAGMTGLRGDLEKELNMPVLDPVETGYMQLEMLVKRQMIPSKAGLYAKPYQKDFQFE